MFINDKQELTVNYKQKCLCSSNNISIIQHLAPFPYLFVFDHQGGWEHISVRGNSAEAPRAPYPSTAGHPRSPGPPQPPTQANGNAVGVQRLPIFSSSSSFSSPLFVPGSTFVSSDHSHGLLSLHVKGMHNHATEFILKILVGFDS